MGYKSWVIPFLLAASGVLAEEKREMKPFRWNYIVNPNLDDKLCNFPSIENGEIAQYYYSFKKYYFPMKEDDRLSYSCLPGYTTENGSRNARITCTTRGWTPVPRCYKKCSRPPLDNGIFSATKLSYKIWENLQYNCDSGHLTWQGNKNETIQCLPDGWSHQPKCMEATDSALEHCLAPDLLHGVYLTDLRAFNRNEKLKYECDAGYRSVVGSTVAEVVCHPEGWSHVPKCTELGCSALSPLEHGGIHPRKRNYDEGNVVQFFCLEGYSLRGAELIQCYYFGWYPEPPICEERRHKCPPPPRPPNAKLLTDVIKTYHHGDVVRLECERPFQIRGAEQIRCDNGRWTTPPKCIDAGIAVNTDDGLHNLENDGSCGSPPLVENSFLLDPLLPSYKTGSAVEYRCRSYYLIKGPETIRCVQGSWTEPPICLEPCSVDGANVSQYNIQMKWKLEGEIYFLHGNIIEFECKPGYVLPPSASESQLLVQCSHGELNYPKCISKDLSEDCGSPPVIKNGIVTSLLAAHYVDGSAVDYSCQENHFLQGSRTMFCSKGQWSTPPVCIEPCTLSEEELLKNNLDLRWSFDNRLYFVHGEFVEFICKAYHIRQPSSSPSDFRVPCHNGQVLYPACIKRQR